MRITPLLSALLLSTACKGGQDDSAPVDTSDDTTVDTETDTDTDSDTDTDTDTDSDTDADTDSDTDTDTDTEPVKSTGVPVVVYWTVDTLSQPAANETDFCTWMQDIVEPHGVDLACVDGGVSPSTWTGETHSRSLYPQNTEGEGRQWIQPACETRSVIAHLADALGGDAIWGSDNPVFTEGAPSEPCPDGSNPWIYEVDEVFSGSGRDEDMAQVPEEDRPVRLALDALLERSAKGEPVVAYVNELQAGGHRPRCYMTPYSKGCDAIWDAAVELGLAPAKADREATWLNPSFWGVLSDALPPEYRDRPEELRSMAWGAIIETAAAIREDTFKPDIDYLLSHLAKQGRLGDLRIAFVADHGERPCTAEPVTGDVACDHAGVPGWWLTQVPVYTLPASLAADWQAEGLVGDATTPWSTVNISYALFDAIETEPPVEWPAPSEVGTATSWQCLEGRVRGARVEGDLSVRCAEADCLAYEWRPLTDVLDEPGEISPIPKEFQDPWLNRVADFPHWFAEACKIPEDLMRD